MAGWWLVVRRTPQGSGVTWSSGNMVMCGHVTNSLARSMVMKLGKFVTYGEVTAPIKLQWNISSLGRCMATKRCSVLTSGRMKPIMKLHDSDHVTTRGPVSNWKLNISFPTKSMQPDSAGKPPIESHDTLTTQFFDVTWKI